MATNNLWNGRGLVKNIKTVSINDTRCTYEVTDITLSIKRTIKGKDKYTLVPLEAWGEMSKGAQHIKGGDLVAVEGHFANKKWQNKEHGMMSKNVIVLEKITKL